MTGLCSVDDARKYSRFMVHMRSGIQARFGGKIREKEKPLY